MRPTAATSRGSSSSTPTRAPWTRTPQIHAASATSIITGPPTISWRACAARSSAMSGPEIRRRRPALALGLALAGLAALALQAHAENEAAAPAKTGIATMPVDDLKPGMRGHAVTVFFGEQTDEFEIEIVDTIRNYLPKQDAVLLRSTDPRLEPSGIVGGMSGSPILV